MKGRSLHELIEQRGDAQVWRPAVNIVEIDCSGEELMRTDMPSLPQVGRMSCGGARSREVRANA